MPSFRIALVVEHKKLRHSLAFLLAMVMPMLVALFSFLSLLRLQHAPWSWDVWMLRAAGVWAFFMLPLGVTALTALVAQVEHGPRTWDHLRALPVPRWHVYAAKAVWTCGVVALMTVALVVENWLALQAAGAIRPAMAPSGVFDVMECIKLFGAIYASALLLIAVQLWVALRYHSFVPALAVGIGGTFFAVVATSAKIGVVLPWQIPLNMLANDPQRVWTALLIGSIGGLVAFALMLVHLSRREVV